MDWDKFINIWLVFANLLMALGTFMMVKETKKSIKLQEKQLKYFYSPTFVCVHESGGNGWPRIRIFNKGSGPAYDAEISLWLITNNKIEKIPSSYCVTRYFMDKVEYWPIEKNVTYDSNFSDNILIESECFKYFAKVESMESIDLKGKIVINYTDHLRQQYTVETQLRIYFDEINRNLRLEFPKGRIFRNSQ